MQSKRWQCSSWLLCVGAALVGALGCSHGFNNAPVNAANDGRVVWADNLGIYGNCVVLDHGYGLQSMYGHMQRIDVKVGDMVKKGGKMGVAGSTGLAEGVHVHFGMQIDGVQINPREWWDEHWIRDRILSKLGPGR